MSARRRAVAAAIREAVDSCPDGLCFAAADGRPILVNRRMNALAEALTGRTVLDAGALWAELTASEGRGGARRLRQPWLPEGEEPALYFQLPGGTVWRFRRLALEEETVQLEAVEVTELCRLSQTLYENNCRLRALQARQKALLEDIVQINQDKELLSAKIRIHGAMGGCLVATERCLAQGTDPAAAERLKDTWRETLRGLAGILPAPPPGGSDPREELLRAAGLIGCHVRFRGETPTGQRPLRLLYAAVREGLTNAVRHAGADVLTVDVAPAAGGWHVEITDNGRPPDGPIREGNGLGDLRRRLEEEGGSLAVRWAGGVRLSLELPAEGERP